MELCTLLVADLLRRFSMTVDFCGYLLVRYEVFDQHVVVILKLLSWSSGYY